MALVLLSAADPSFSQIDRSPLQFLKEQEIRNKSTKGEVYLGRVMTLNYEAYSVEAATKYHPFLLELTDVLKTPMRKNYRLTLKGYSDTSGKSGKNLRLSIKRAEKLKGLLVEKFYMKAKRISPEGHGAKDPIASNKTPEGRKRNRRVEIHVYGDVSEAVRFLD